MSLATKENFTGIKREFPNDQVERVKKGKEGGDIIHKIVG